MSGKYFEKRKEVELTEVSYDQEIAKCLWNVSVDLTNHNLEKKKLFLSS